MHPATRVRRTVNLAMHTEKQIFEKYYAERNHISVEDFYLAGNSAISEGSVLCDTAALFSQAALL